MKLNARSAIAFTLLAVTASQSSIAATDTYSWIVVDGKLIESTVRRPTVSAQTGVPTTAPDVTGRIDKISGIADVKDELRKSLGYWQEAQRLESVRKLAEAELQRGLSERPGSSGVVNVWSNRRSDPTLEPGDPNFVGRYRVGRAEFASTPEDAVAKLGAPVPSHLPMVGAPDPFPHRTYTLYGVRLSNGTVHYETLTPQTLNRLLDQYHERRVFSTGKQLSLAENQVRIAKKQLESSNPSNVNRMQAALDNAEAQLSSARIAYEGQVAARAERGRLKSDREQACSQGDGCAEAVQRETNWYQKAAERQAVAMVAPNSARDFEGQIPSDTPGIRLPTNETPVVDCVYCQLSKASSDFLKQQDRWAASMNQGFGGKPAAGARRLFRRVSR